MSEAIEMLQTRRFSDFKVICEDFEFDVHKNILYPASPFFATLIDGPFSESVDDQRHIRETSCLAVALMILDIYADNFGLDLAYETWPSLRHHAHISLDYPNEEAKRTPNEDYESSLHVLKAANMLEIQTWIRLSELADRLMLPCLSISAANVVVQKLERNFGSPTQLPSTTPSMADNARIMLDVYQYMKTGDRLRNQSVAVCVQRSIALEAAGGHDALVLLTIRAHPGISHDWELGMEVARMMQMAHDRLGTCAWRQGP